MNNELFFDRAKLTAYAEELAAHHSNDKPGNPHAAPCVAEWCDQVLERLCNGRLTVAEMMRFARMVDGGKYMDRHYANNTAYKALAEFGHLPVGMVSF